MLTPARAARAIRLRAQVLRHRGDRVRCPICGHSFDRFRSDWNRSDALCWRCGSHERHRAQWLLLEQRPEMLRGADSLLHFAPEWSLRSRLSQRSGLRYVTADLDDTGVDLHLDLTHLDLEDASFDAVICSHVLEHVPDDQAAMRELRRVTRQWCLVMVPLDLGREHTYEDSGVVSPEARTRAFWQHDHVRLYAPDIEQRLGAAGFAVERIEPAQAFGPSTMRRCGLHAADYLWLCRPRPAQR